MMATDITARLIRTTPMIPPQERSSSASHRKGYQATPRPSFYTGLDEGRHAVVLRSAGAERDRTHLREPGRGTRSGGAGSPGCPVAVSLPPDLPRDDWRD